MDSIGLVQHFWLNSLITYCVMIIFSGQTRTHANSDDLLYFDHVEASKCENTRLSLHFKAYASFILTVSCSNA